jgi:hypothetical protein
LQKRIEFFLPKREKTDAKKVLGFKKKFFILKLYWKKIIIGIDKRIEKGKIFSKNL